MAVGGGATTSVGSGWFVRGTDRTVRAADVLRPRTRAQHVKGRMPAASAGDRGGSGKHHAGGRHQRLVVRYGAGAQFRTMRPDQESPKYPSTAIRYVTFAVATNCTRLWTPPPAASSLEATSVNVSTLAPV